MKLSLISKITILTNIVIVLVMAFYAYLNIKTLENAMLREVIAHADKLSETILRSSQHDMLDADLAETHRMISNVGKQKGIEVIRLINKNGRINFSTRDAEIGLFVDKKAEACSMCHLDDGEPRTHASTMNSSRLFTDHEGHEVLGMAKAIYNEESCFTASCHFHPEQIKILGVLDVVMSLDPMNSLVDEYRNKKIALTISLVVVISLCLALLMQKLVNHPMRQLVQHTQLLATGDLDREVRIASGDELDELAGAINAMTGSLKKARSELEDWGKNLEIKVEERTAEIRQMERHLMRSEKLASLGELVAGIAHELNNPLTGMLVFTSLVRNDQRLPPELAGDLDIVIQETERCAKIVRGLLNFSRESLPQPTPSSLNILIETSLTLIGHQSFFHDIEISRVLAEDLPLALVDPDQVEQVLINILLNASQAMPSGGKLTITTGTTENGLRIYTRISDTGCGIPRDQLGRIFDPFFSTKEKGTGLGLSLCYGIVENNKGRIEVESTVGVGTTFTILFPLLTDDDWDETAGGD